MAEQSIVEKAKNIKLLICDVDGVLTTGHLYFNNDSSFNMAFHIQDGVGLVLLQQTGVKVAIITSSNSKIIANRMKQLNISHVYQGDYDKFPIYQKLLQSLNLSSNEVACIGDDLPELPIMQDCGLSVGVANATQTILDKADYVTKLTGGNGAVRELCDLIMLAQNTTKSAFNKLLKKHDG